MKVDNRLEYVIDYEIEQSKAYQVFIKRLKDMVYEMYYLNYKLTLEMRVKVKKIDKDYEQIRLICKQKLKL